MAPSELLTLLSSRYYPESIGVNPGGMTLSVAVVVFGLVAVLVVILFFAFISTYAKRDVAKAKNRNNRKRIDRCQKIGDQENPLYHDRERILPKHSVNSRGTTITFDEFQIEELTDEILV